MRHPNHKNLSERSTMRSMTIGAAVFIPLSILGFGEAPSAFPPSRLSAPCFSAALPEIQAAVTREDSLALAAQYGREPPGGDEGCGRMLEGYLVGMTSTPAEDEWRDRQRAVGLLERALRYTSDEPRIYLAMGLLLYHRQARTDAVRSLGRALDRRDRGEVPLTAREIAVIHYIRGLIAQDHWRDWRSFGALDATSGGQWHCGRYESPASENFTSSSDDHTWLVFLNQLCPETFSRNMETFFEPRADMNLRNFVDLQAAFREAIATDSSYILPYEALLGEYVYMEMWVEAEPLAKTLYERLPEQYRSYLYLGLVMHETGRDSIAAPIFARSFLYMPDSMIAEFENIGALLQPEQQEWFAEADENTRRAATTAYWNSLDPLYLTTENERKLEHYARMTAAELVLSSRTLRERGWSSYAGEIWIRYGRPLHMWELKIPAGRVVFWDYGEGPDVSFTRGSAYRSYRATDEARQYTNRLQRTSPQAYAATALLDSVEALGYQVVRLLDPDDRPQFLIYTDWPSRYAPETLAGLTLFDAQFLPVAQWRGGKPDRPGLRAELNGLSPGSYSLTVEMWDRATRQLGRVRDTLSTLSIEDSAFTVSDILLATEIRSVVGDDATSRRDIRIEPLWGGTLDRGQTLGLYWESYRLSGERDGRMRYRVRLEVLDASRRPIIARVLSGVGVSRDRSPATRIEYDSNRPLANGRAVEWLELTGELAAGEYRIVLTLKDEDSGREVKRERALMVR